jgi:hypothetical protein
MAGTVVHVKHPLNIFPIYSRILWRLAAKHRIDKLRYCKMSSALDEAVKLAVAALEQAAASKDATVDEIDKEAKRLEAAVLAEAETNSAPHAAAVALAEKAAAAAAELAEQHQEEMNGAIRDAVALGIAMRPKNTTIAYKPKQEKFTVGEIGDFQQVVNL